MLDQFHFEAEKKDALFNPEHSFQCVAISTDDSAGLYVWIQLGYFVMFAKYGINILGARVDHLRVFIKIGAVDYFEAL